MAGGDEGGFKFLWTGSDNVLSADRFKSFSRRVSALLMGRTFSVWWGSNDKLRGERDPGVNGICDEAVGFDAFHGLRAGSSSASLLRVTRGRTVTSVMWCFTPMG